MKLSDVTDVIRRGKCDPIIEDMLAIPANAVYEYRDRLEKTVRAFAETYGEDRDISVFSVGGRSEISGNHTDHNGGKVITACVNMDIIAVASPTDDGIIRVKGDKFPEDVVLPGDEDEVCESKYFTSAALIAGMKNAFKARGYKVGGFVAYTSSNILKGSGLSSSAAFEVMIGKLLSYFYNINNVDYAEIARSAQYAENVYFGKPCGLMDQMACAAGGMTSIDFSDIASPSVTKLDFLPAAYGLSLCVTNTGSSHADLNDEYAAVPAEMKKIASFFSKNRLCEVAENDVRENASLLREKFGDRALLRAFHFYDETNRVNKQIDALNVEDTDTFLRLVTESGLSSFRYLQNIYSPKNSSDQALATALYMTERFLDGKRGAHRVHGGGFAGTVMAFIPSEFTESYKSHMEKLFGTGSCHVLNVRQAGGIKII